MVKDPPQVAAKIKAMGISSPTYYAWKKRPDWIGDHQPIEAYAEYSKRTKQGGHDGRAGSPLLKKNRSEDPKEELEAYAKKVILQNKKLEVDIEAVEQKLHATRSDIAREITAEVRDEMQALMSELIKYVKTNETYDGKKLKSLYKSCHDKLQKAKLAEEKRK